MSYVTKVARWHCNWCPRTYSTQRAGGAHEERCPENPKRQPLDEPGATACEKKRGDRDGRA